MEIRFSHHKSLTNVPQNLLHGRSVYQVKAATFNVPRNSPNEWKVKTAHPIKNMTIQRVHPSISSKLNPRIQQMICPHPWSSMAIMKLLSRDKITEKCKRRITSISPKIHQNSPKKITKIHQNSIEASSGNAH